MNAIKPAIESSISFTPDQVAVLSEPITGDDLTIGTGFKAQSFRARDIGDVMDPLVMVDHYLMTASTFGTHPHAGMSAVSLLFEDSEGAFHNRDSLGNDFDLQPGDLYWLSAGSGAMHDESPRAEARIHGLQVFVNVPQTQRLQAPTSLLVRSKTMPVISERDYRVKVALGESHGVRGAASPSIPMTILDGALQPNGRFQHQSAANRGIWVQAVKGHLEVVVDKATRYLKPGQAVAIKSVDSAKVSIRNASDEPAHFALFDGALIAETYVHDGPFVMGSREQIAAIKVAFEAGQFGRIPNHH